MILEGACWKQIIAAILAISVLGIFIMKMAYNKWPWDKYLK